MQEIQVGEYIRTKEDGICKLIAKEMDADGKFCGAVDKPFWLRENNIANHSFNILDLIEGGDYINGMLVEECSDGDYEDEKYELCVYDTYYEYYIPIKNIDIETIVTKEQFSKLEYGVK